MDMLPLDGQLSVHMLFFLSLFPSSWSLLCRDDPSIGAMNLGIPVLTWTGQSLVAQQPLEERPVSSDSWSRCITLLRLNIHTINYHGELFFSHHDI